MLTAHIYIQICYDSRAERDFGFVLEGFFGSKVTISDTPGNPHQNFTLLTPESNSKHR